jgi:hypothetical protein
MHRLGTLFPSRMTIGAPPSTPPFVGLRRRAWTGHLHSQPFAPRTPSSSSSTVATRGPPPRLVLLSVRHQPNRARVSPSLRSEGEVGSRARLSQSWGVFLYDALYSENSGRGPYGDRLQLAKTRGANMQSGFFLFFFFLSWFNTQRTLEKP